MYRAGLSEASQPFGENEEEEAFPAKARGNSIGKKSILGGRMPPWDEYNCI